MTNPKRDTLFAEADDIGRALDETVLKARELNDELRIQRLGGTIVITSGIVAFGPRRGISMLEADRRRNFDNVDTREPIDLPGDCPDDGHLSDGRWSRSADTHGERRGGTAASRVTAASAPAFPDNPRTH